MATDFGAAAHDALLSTTPNQAYFAALAAAGVKHVRLAAVWAYVEPTQGQRTGYAPNNADGLPRGFDQMCDGPINTALAAGLNVLLLLNTPRPGWAGTGSSTDWGKFAGAAAARYAPGGAGITAANSGKGVLAYEIGNEWNVGANWDTGSWWYAGGVVMSEIAAFQNAAYTAIKGVQPQAQVGTGGAAACVDWANRWGSRGPAQVLPSNYVTQLYQNGCKGYFDWVGYHPYTMANDYSTWQPPTQTHQFIDQIAQIHSVLASNGEGSKKIWPTEYGYSRSDFPEATVRDYLSQEWNILHTPTYAPYLDKHFVYCGRDFIYPGQTYSTSTREQNFGLLHQDLTPTLAYQWAQTL